MKIIKEGQLPDKQIFRGTCSHCKTQFECERWEGNYENHQRDGDFLRVNCPLCDKSAIAYPARGGSLIGQDQRSSLADQYSNPSSFYDR